MKPTKAVVLLSIIGTIILAGIFTLFLPKHEFGIHELGLSTSSVINTDITFVDIAIALLGALIFGVIAIGFGLFEIRFLQSRGIDVASKLSLSGTLGAATIKADTIGAIGFLVVQPMMLFLIAVGILVLLGS